MKLKIEPVLPGDPDYELAMERLRTFDHRQSVTIDALIAELEKDPKKKAVLDEARLRLKVRRNGCKGSA